MEHFCHPTPTLPHSSSPFTLENLPNDILLSIANHLRKDGQPEEGLSSSTQTDQDGSHFGYPTSHYHSKPIQHKGIGYIAIDEFGQVVRDPKPTTTATLTHQSNVQSSPVRASTYHWPSSSPSKSSAKLGSDSMDLDLQTSNDDHSNNHYHNEGLNSEDLFTSKKPFPGTCCSNHLDLSGDTCSLNSWMQVSKSMYALIHPILYQEVALLDCELGNYLSALERNSRLSLLTRKLIFRGHRGGEKRVIEAATQVCRDSIKMETFALGLSKDGKRSVEEDSTMTLWLVRCGLNLKQSLAINSTCRASILSLFGPSKSSWGHELGFQRLISRGMEGSVDDALTSMIYQNPFHSSGLTTLKSIELSWSPTNQSGFHLKEIEKLLYLPNLDDLTILGIACSNFNLPPGSTGNEGFDAEIEDQALKKIMKRKRSNLKSLRISGIFNWSSPPVIHPMINNDPLVQPNPLISLLSPLALKKFEIKILSWGFHCPALHEGLFNSRKTLKSLTILGIDPYYNDLNQDSLLRNLKGFENLKKLKLTMMHFLARDRRVGVGMGPMGQVQFWQPPVDNVDAWIWDRNWLPHNLPDSLEILELVRISNWDKLTEVEQWIKNKREVDVDQEDEIMTDVGNQVVDLLEHGNYLLVPQNLKKINVDKIFLGHYKSSYKENKMGETFKMECEKRDVKVGKCE